MLGGHDNRTLLLSFHLHSHFDILTPHTFPFPPSPTSLSTHPLQESYNTGTEIRPSPYAGRTFPVKLVFPANYPFKAPAVTFPSEVLWHPQVEFKTGIVCAADLEKMWGPTKTVADVAKFVLAFLGNPSLESATEVRRKCFDFFFFGGGASHSRSHSHHPHTSNFPPAPPLVSQPSSFPICSPRQPSSCARASRTLRRRLPQQQHVLHEVVVVLECLAG
jgi:hypothetical protein